MPDLRAILRQMMAEQAMDAAEVGRIRAEFERIGEAALRGEIDPRAGGHPPVHGVPYRPRIETPKSQPWRRDSDVQPL